MKKTIIKKILYNLNFSARFREMFEEQHSDIISSILKEYPENIDKKIFVDMHYSVYLSYRIGENNKKIYTGLFYDIYKDRILLNGMDITYQVSSKFPEQIFKKLDECYLNKYKPQPTR